MFCFFHLTPFFNSLKALCFTEKSLIFTERGGFSWRKGSHNNGLSLKRIGDERPVLQSGASCSGHGARGASPRVWGTVDGA